MHGNIPRSIRLKSMNGKSSVASDVTVSLVEHVPGARSGHRQSDHRQCQHLEADRGCVREVGEEPAGVVDLRRLGPEEEEVVVGDPGDGELAHDLALSGSASP
jgi:hypothetical protein